MSLAGRSGRCEVWIGVQSCLLAQLYHSRANTALLSQPPPQGLKTVMCTIVLSCLLVAHSKTQYMGLSASVSPIIGLVESEQNRRERQASFRDIPSSFNLFSCAATLYFTQFFCVCVCENPIRTDQMETDLTKLYQTSPKQS